ncbi:hypothetical protein CERZMDRAFT_103650 [Cercospora zeae-maydis SCOH1-5]|uniref:Uncharacterized protein n=1 Tax=Cercospora zeae-maydis SCOH1-5 TaxID=717836 RepID=A0A6A6EXM6_9PEZI|nr:hypothetical protein CERZMDRAFT_103650 [Cercospora zeae-maydis SCOH1-5]
MDSTSGSTTRANTSTSAPRDHNERARNHLFTQIQHLEAVHTLHLEYLVALINARETLETTTIAATAAAVPNLMRKHIDVEESARIAYKEAASALDSATHELKLHLIRTANAAPTYHEQRDRLAYAALRRQYRGGGQIESERKSSVQRGGGEESDERLHQ